jgi:thiol-disulfide isomerase/thioredoxin
MRLLLLALVAACKSDPPPPVASDPAPPAPQQHKVAFVPAGKGDVASLVQHEIAHAEGKRVMVYVGATWCEPCRRFHDVAQTGELDKVLPPIRFIEFDLDKDEDRLKAAGYESKYIPLFAVPRPDGHASGKQIAGSVSGPGSPAEITARLQVLLKDG